MNKITKRLSRRHFMGQISCAGMGYMTLMNSLLNFKAINAAAVSNSSPMDDYKAIVCILQAGGNDSFNTLIPRTDHGQYSTTRSNLAIPLGDILPLTGLHNNKSYGVHPSLSGVRDLYNAGKLSFISNVGTLMAPMTKSEYINKSKKLPLGLFSHSDQIQQWQTAIMDRRTATGWGGKIADVVSAQNLNQNISMNVTLSGTNIFQAGNETVEYTINSGGSIGIDGYDPQSNWIFRKLQTNAVDNMLGQNYQDIFKKTYVDTIINSKNAHEIFSSAIAKFRHFEQADEDNPEGALADTFSLGNRVSQDLKMIARSIAVSTKEADNDMADSDTLGFKRQIFFVNFGGWDHHDELLDSQVGMLGLLGDALKEFNVGLQQIGMENKVLTMTTSEFGRTLTSNGDGSDHAWGGNVMVMGGNNLINGQMIYGKYPSLELGSDDDIGNGVILPTTATDCYFAEVAKWFGVSHSNISDIFPSLSEFHSISSNTNPIGFIK